MCKEDYSRYDEIAGSYDTFFCDKESLEENSDVAKMLSQVSGKVYEIGCGTGLLTELIKITPENYYGVDPSSAMLDKFMDKHYEYRHRVMQDAFERDSVDINKFDWVISLFGSISYVEPESLKKIANGELHYFLMFYKPDYFPVTYTLAGVDFYHYKHSREKLESIFTGAIVEEFNNYLIVSK